MPVARQTPAGIMLEDGHPTKVTLANDPDISFWEKVVTPPGIEGGGENEVVTMHNTVWRPKAPKKLKTLTELTLTAGYDPAVLAQIVAQINQNQEITVWWPDGSNWYFWGWLDAFTPSDVEEGEDPEAEITIIPSNRNASKVETGPAYTAPP